MALLLRAFVGTAARAVAGRGERLLFVACVVLLVLMGYRAATREQLRWTPDDLSTAADDARRRLAATPPSPPSVPPYDELAKRGRDKVDHELYNLVVYFSPPPPQRPRRPTPPVFCVEELLASGGHGVFTEVADSMSAGGCSLRGHRWAVVTGAIQHLRQADAFREAFERSPVRDFARDYPKYVSFRVERAEIDPRSDSMEPEWKPLDVRAMYELQDRWPAAAFELADERCFPPVLGDIGLVFPLGPREDRPWGKEVGHPKVPMRPAPEAGNPGAPGGSGRTGFQPVQEKNRNGTRPRVAPGGATDRRAGSNPRGGDRRQDGKSQDGGGGRQVGSLPYGGRPAEEAGEPECLLLRFFDYGVEPGKNYCYRVKLLLANPNYGVQGKFLENEEAAKVEFLESAWSEPSGEAAVPRDTGVLVVAADAKKKAALLLTHLQMKAGEFTAEEFPAARGQWLNFRGRPLKPCGPSQIQGQFPAVTPARRSQPAEPKIDYLTDALVLDVQGGGPLVGKRGPAEPALVLLLDSGGNLIVRNELDDLAERRFYRPAAQSSEPSSPMAGLPPMRRGALSER